MSSEDKRKLTKTINLLEGGPLPAYTFPGKTICPVCQTVKQWQNSLWSYYAEGNLRPRPAFEVFKIHGQPFRERARSSSTQDPIGTHGRRSMVLITLSWTQPFASYPSQPSASYGSQEKISIRIQKITKCCFICLVPPCTNFGLKQTAEDNKEMFSEEAVRNGFLTPERSLSLYPRQREQSRIRII